MWRITVNDSSSNETYLVQSGSATAAIGKVLLSRFPEGDLPDVLDIRLEPAREGLLRESAVQE